MQPLKEVVGLPMTEAIKASWLTGRRDLWRRQTHKRFFPSVDVFGNIGEQKQLVTEEIKGAVDNVCLFLFLMLVGGGLRTCVTMFLVLGVTEKFLHCFCPSFSFMLL